MPSPQGDPHRLETGARCLADGVPLTYRQIELLSGVREGTLYSRVRDRKIPFLPNPNRIEVEHVISQLLTPEEVLRMLQVMRVQLLRSQRMRTPIAERELPA